MAGYGHYYVNNTAQINGDHEVHGEGCYWLGLARSVIDLGWHSSCYDAVSKARSFYRQSNGCATCSSACHTQ